jgi:uncharacterized iron-regulated membrane protein
LANGRVADTDINCLHTHSGATWLEHFLMTQNAPDGFKGSFRQSMAWLHTWVGLLLSVVLYFMFVTGTAGYFHQEITRWMQPEQAQYNPAVGPSASETAQRGVAALTERLPRADAYYITLPTQREGPVLYAFGDPLGDGEEVDLQLDPLTGAAFAPVRETGGGGALYAMHYALHYMPFDTAMYIVGVATMFMLLAILTGVIVHRKIFADFFTFRPGKQQRSWLDAHNLSGVLALPFMVMITYSGLIFFQFDYAPAAKWAIYGSGDQAYQQIDADIYPSDARAEASGIPAALAAVGPMVAAAEQRWGTGSVRNIRVENPGDANAIVVINRYPSSAAFTAREDMRFNGVNGTLVQSPRQAQLPSTHFAELLLTLHEGHFAGPVLRWAYLISGLFGAAMVAIGMVLWTTKRRQRLKAGDTAHRGLVFVERLNVGAIVGLPIGISCYFLANRLLPLGMADRAAWELHVLFIGWGAALVHSALRPAKAGWTEQLIAAAMLFVTIPIVNAFNTDVHLLQTLGIHGASPDWVLASFDISMIVIGLSFLIAGGRRLRTPLTSRAPALRLEPAE